MGNTRTVRQFLFQLLIQPFFPFIQWFGRVTGIAKEAKTLEGKYRRQPFLVGLLKPGTRVEDAIALLKTKGFYMHRVAYPDPGQVVSMRRLDDVNPTHQFHLRIFSDSEVRGHYEFTPEDNFMAHMNETIRDPRHEEYMKWLAPIIDEKKEN
jgi:hypothetical protein